MEREIKLYLVVIFFFYLLQKNQGYPTKLQYSFTFFITFNHVELYAQIVKNDN